MLSVTRQLHCSTKISTTKRLLRLSIQSLQFHHRSSTMAPTSMYHTPCIYPPHPSTLTHIPSPSQASTNRHLWPLGLRQIHPPAPPARPISPTLSASASRTPLVRHARGEQHGKHYHYTSKEDFRDLVQGGGFFCRACAVRE